MPDLEIPDEIARNPRAIAALRKQREALGLPTDDIDRAVERVTQKQEEPKP